MPLLVADAYSLRLDEEDMKDEGGAPSLVRCWGRCACWQLTCCCLLLLGWVHCRGFMAPWMLRRASVQSGPLGLAVCAVFTPVSFCTAVHICRMTSTVAAASRLTLGTCQASPASGRCLRVLPPCAPASTMLQFAACCALHPTGASVFLSHAPIPLPHCLQMMTTLSCACPSQTATRMARTQQL